jgi:hypothetical protein
MPFDLLDVARAAGRRSLHRCGVAALLALVGTSALAADYDYAALIQGGVGDRNVRSGAIGISRSFSPIDTGTGSPWSFYGEAVLGEWFVHHPPGGQRTAFTQVTLAPVVRYDLGRFVGHAFIEVGVGLSFITPHFRDEEREFSTVFNFDDHASLGYRFGDRGENEISIRAEHFSNGGIKNPNPGQNFGQIRYARHF